MKAFKTALIGACAAVGFAVLGSTAAMATPVFTIAPASIPGVNPTVAPIQVSDFGYISDSLVRQTSATTQTENGWALITSLSNNGVLLGNPATGLNSYQLYFTYTVAVNNSGFNSSGNITQFDFSMYADPNSNDSFAPGSTAGTGSNPTITGNGDDILLATGSLIYGGAGFNSIGAPLFGAEDTFIVKDSAYFTSPVPFYNMVLASTTAASAGSVFVNTANGTATINGIAGSANFVPEPLTLSIFGAGLVGAGALRRRKNKAKKA